MTRRELLITFIIMTLMIGCSTTSNSGVGPDQLNSGPKPSWLIEQPVDPNYYVGIGSAAKTQYGAEAQKSAQDLALADLASQITVTISSDIVTSLIERGAITEEEYMATTRSEAVADLEGHELVDTWQDANYHYAFYRLSKAEYAAIQARKRKAAVALSADYLSKAKAASALNQFSDSYHASIQAFIPLLPYLNEALEADIDGHRVILSNEVNSHLHELLSNIKLAPNKSNLTAKLGQPLSAKLTVHAKGAKGHPLRGLPLKVHFEKGAGELVERVKTGDQGVATLQVTNITAPSKLQVLEVTVDFQQLMKTVDSPILAGILNSIAPATTRIVLDVSNPSIYFVANESFVGKDLKQLLLEPRLKNHFIGEGFHFVDNVKAADWQMTLQASAIQGTEYSGMYTAFANVSLSVIDRSSGDEIYKNSLSRVKGIDLSYQNAANKALNSAADKMISSIVPEILESLK